MPRLSTTDPSSFSQPEFVKINHIDLDWGVNFTEKVISGSAQIQFVILAKFIEEIVSWNRLLGRFMLILIIFSSSMSVTSPSTPSTFSTTTARFHWSLKSPTWSQMSAASSQSHSQPRLTANSPWKFTTRPRRVPVHFSGSHLSRHLVSGFLSCSRSARRSMHDQFCRVRTRRQLNSLLMRL